MNKQTKKVLASNLLESINKFADSLNIQPEDVGFRIISEKLLENEDGDYDKEYEVEFFPFAQESSLMMCDVISTIEIEGSNPPKKAYLLINPQLLKNNVYITNEDIIETIKRKLALHGVKIGIKENLYNAIAEEIKKRLTPNHKPFKVLVAEWVKPVDGKNSRLIYHFNRYKASGTVSNNGKIDYKNKNFIIPTRKGALLIEYYKPTTGKAGYDIFGKKVEQHVGSIVEELDLEVDNKTIKVVEDDNSLKIYSKNDGVISCSKGMLSVEKTIDINKVDIKTTGNIEGDKGVDLKIGSTSSDEIEDTVSAGMKVVGRSVVVNGDVGPHALIEAEDVEIKGSVHQDAVIKAKHAKIAVCRGSVESEVAEIDTAEHARILSKNKAVVKDCIASKIISPEIEITGNMMFSNITTSSKNIMINNVTGDNSTIAVRPMELPWIKEEYKKLLINKESFKLLLENSKKKCNKLKRRINQEKNRYKKALDVIKELKDSKKDVPGSFLIVIKKFKDLTKLYKESVTELRVAKSKYKENLEKMDEIVNSYKKGHILIKGEIEAGNILIFNDKLKRILDSKQNNIKVYVRDLDGKQDIVIEPI